jgi:hypothetical protein
MEHVMKIINKVLTDRACEDATGLLATIDGNEEQATIALNYLLSVLGDRKLFRSAGKRERDAIEALMGSVIPFAIENPGGHVERVLRKRGFLIPEIVARFNFKEGSN